MEFLAAFRPMLAGPVLEGTVERHGAVTLHLYDDDADAVARFLQDHGIPAESGQRRLRLDPRRVEEFPTWQFFAGDTPFELVVLPSTLSRQAPLEPGDDRPMRRATTEQLRRLLRE